MPTPEEITKHWYNDPDVEWVGPPRAPSEIVISEYDEGWPRLAAIEIHRIAAALGDLQVNLEHVGSTSVPGLPAKPILDIDLTVPDPTDEGAYIPQLESAGYEFRFRERVWHEHRFLRRDGPQVNLHVFGPESPELVRHRLLRDWLRAHPDDAAAYAAVKRHSADASNASAEDVMAYNRRKEPFIRELLDRIFRAEGLLP
jgi:GrpB-like predicted nucleotidyltransferase (UPF0157 family)